MSYLFTVTTRPEASVVSALIDLSMRPVGSKAPPRLEAPEVYLLKSNGDHYLAATDGSVVRVQKVALSYGAGTMEIAKEKTGPTTHETPLLALLEGWQEAEELLELERGALKLGEKVDRRPTRSPRSWAASPVPESPIVSTLRAHVRALPSAFGSWFFLLRADALARFAATFPEGMEPPVFFVPESQDDPQDAKRGKTWAKYWAFHATTGEPLGAVMGVRSPETLERFKAKK